MLFPMNKKLLFLTVLFPQFIHEEICLAPTKGNPFHLSPNKGKQKDYKISSRVSAGLTITFC